MAVPLTLNLGSDNTGLTLTGKVKIVGTPAATVSVNEDGDDAGSYVASFSAAASTSYSWWFEDGSGRRWGGRSFVTDANGDEVLTASASAIASAVSAALDGQSVTHTNPVDTSDDERLTIVSGDDYSSGSGRIPSWTVTSYSGPALSATGKLRFLPMASYRKLGTDAAAEAEINVTVSTSGNTLTITAPLLTSDVTSTLSTSPPEPRDSHMYQLIGITSTGGKENSLKLATATISRRIPSAA